DQFELNRYSENVLRQVVVYLARYAITLGQHRAELVGHGTHAHAIQLPRSERQQDETESVKPIRLVKAWLEIELNRRSSLIPNAIVVCCNYTQLVVAGPEVCVRGDTSCAAVDPVVVEAFEFVFETHVLRCDKTQRRVIEIKPRTTRR